MTNDLFIKMIMAVFTLVCGIITAYVVPYIKTKMTVEQLDQIGWIVATGVRCAEQIYTPEQWKAKMQYVMEYAKASIAEHFDIHITDGELNAIVEGIVNEVKHGK